ncbi:uncharacterized protein LOC114353111 [Ostrinia furnacalis]|uniref:uncharacterized protein LOC114352700 n=1 Tax=Ostrinia furnacalis TaxID=93504 RepID=UPI0010395437|nr:uncharacterized protein LOC114352700 [Ostrinia furnacalis]XP_028160744.1 uncharacterized protein LOC114353111 [Ostrinia furnacalis]
MEKLKFTFEVKPSTDGKSNYIAVTSITTQDDKVFLIPEEYQAVSLHKHIQTSKTFTTVKNTLKKRYQSRGVWIKMTEGILQTYMDEDDNMIFQDQLLEETTQEQLAIASKKCSEDPIVKILEKLVEGQQNREKQSIKKLADRFVIEKFDGKNSSAYQWMSVFEKECERFNITQDEEKIEIFRLFLEKSCNDWYSSMMIKLGLQSEWSEWKSSFLQTYASKGWTTSKYALSFKYQSGSLLEYAVKKEKLLLEVRKTIDEGTLIDIIAAGLPDFITDRINKEEIEHTKHLFNALGRLEHLVTRKKFIKKREDTKPIKEKCGICEKLKKGIRYHSEDSCWFKTKMNTEKDKKQIKLINNSELECELQCEDQKN